MWIKYKDGDIGDKDGCIGWEEKQSLSSRNSNRISRKGDENV